MLQSDLQAERFTGRKISNLWVKEMFVFFGKETDYSFNDTKAGMGFHYDCGRKNEKFVHPRQIWQICYGFRIDTRLHTLLKKK